MAVIINGVIEFVVLVVFNEVLVVVGWLGSVGHCDGAVGEGKEFMRKKVL